MGYVQYAHVIVDYNLFIPIKMNIGIYIYMENQTHFPRETIASQCGSPIIFMRVYLPDGKLP
jgi:hypothetical protein